MIRAGPRSGLLVALEYSVAEAPHWGLLPRIMMTGQAISHYRIVRRLGTGGMGAVYEAEDTHLQRRVALKFLPQDLAAKPSMLERFKREARAVAALNHPNIVVVHSVEHADETHFLSMELVEGRPLGELIPPGGLALEKLFALGIPLADALAAAHARGIIHRDLKPSNVMVNEQGRVKVIDFGLARMLQAETAVVDPEAPTVHQTMAGQVLGTPAYMSPEQIEGRKLDHRTDIFSLGIVLHEMVVGERPFKGDGSMAIMAAILRDAPPMLRELKPGVPEHLGRIVRRCLQKSLDERYQSALEVRNELQGLQEEVENTRQNDSATTVDSPRPDAPVVAGRHNLPEQLTSFVGRERELAEVVDLISGGLKGGPGATRLLTLTGPGGTGKTRLALQVAGALIGRFPDGVRWVELAALADPSLVPQNVVSALGLINTAGLPSPELLTRHLALKQTLLVLDNCEHLVTTCAELADALLRTCPRLHILATSREALRLAGEVVWPVPPLSVPESAEEPRNRDRLGALGRYESVKLFVERTRSITPAFELTEQNLEPVSRICRQLDGIPLAIELAAARTRLLPVDQLLDRLQDRFRLLTGGRRGALPRQQTLRALVDWSYELLSEPERLLFDRLSVFAGGWTLEAAEAVCVDGEDPERTDAQSRGQRLDRDEILDLLERLQEKSMVVGEPSSGGAVRQRLLETLRQYGQEKLTARGPGTSDATRTRHAAYFVEFGTQGAQGMHGPDQGLWLERVAREHDNLRVVLDWGKAPGAPAERVELALRLAATLHVSWMRSGHGREARQHAESLLAHPNAHPPTRARAQLLIVAGSLAMWQDGNHPDALTFLTRGRLLAEELDDSRLRAKAHQELGQLHYNQGDLSAARRHHEESLRICRAHDDRLGIRVSLENLADVTADEGDSARATELYEEALSYARQSGDHHGIASVLQSMGSLAHATGKTGIARGLIGEALGIMHRIGCLHCSARYLGDLALVAATSGESNRAVRLQGAADALRERTGLVASKSSAKRIDEAMDRARSVLGATAHECAWSEGRAMSLTQATAFALEPTTTPA